MVHWRKPRLVPKPRGAKRIKAHGYTFDSAGELRRYEELALLVRSEILQNLVVHPKLSLFVNGKQIGRGYITLDFKYQERETACGAGKWVTVYEDYKPVDTRESRLRRELCEAIHDIDIRITSKTRRG